MNTPAADRSTSGAVAVLILVTGLVRVGLAASIGLCVDESYIVGVSRDLALSYFDHPPLHVWLVGLWARMIGNEHALSVRVPFIILFAGSSYLLYRLTALAYGRRAGLWAVIGLNLAPVFTVSFASWVLPDGPLIFFALLSALCIARIVVAQPPNACAQWEQWLGTGAAAGCALLSKYLGISVIAGFAAFLLSARQYRQWLGTAGPWLGLCASILMFAPALVWNAEHNWMSFVFQGSRAVPRGFHYDWLLQDVFGQLAYLLPWIAIPLAAVLVKAIRGGPSDSLSWLFACLAFIPIAFFTALGAWARVLPHWPMIGWLFTFPLLGNAVAQLEQSRPRFVLRSAVASTIFVCALVAVAATQAATGWITRLVPAALASDPTLDVFDWATLERNLVIRGLLQPGTVVATADWIDGGKVDYALRGRYVVVCLCADPHGFQFMHDLRHYTGENVLIVVNETRRDWRERIAPYVQQIELLTDLTLTRGGRAAVVLHVAQGVGLRIPG